MKLLPHLAALAVAALCTVPAFAQTETLLTKRPAELRRTPDDKSASVASLPAQAPLTKTSLRVGPWLQVKTADAQTGWVHMFDVGVAGNAQAPTANAATGALRGLSNFFSGAQSRSTTTATSTVGIRGLGAEDIANAQPNLAALSGVEAQRQDANAARRFASEAPLVARTVDNLPEPAAPGSKPQTQEAVQ